MADSENPTPASPESSASFDSITGKLWQSSTEKDGGFRKFGLLALPTVAVGEVAWKTSKQLAEWGKNAGVGAKDMGKWAFKKGFDYSMTALNAFGVTAIKAGLQTAEIGLNTADNTAATPYRLAASIGNSIRGILTLNPKAGFAAAAQNIRDVYTPFLKNAGLLIGVAKDAPLRATDVVAGNTLRLFGFNNTADKLHSFMGKIATTSIFRNISKKGLDGNDVALQSYWGKSDS